MQGGCLASPRPPCIVSQEADYYNSRSRMWIRAVYDICISHNIIICYDGDDDEDDEPFMKCLYPTPDLPFH